MYHPGGTIREALRRIERNEYVLPAIQREFVWSPEQICSLFDSLMQGYPFGEFLFWQIDSEHSAEYKYYGFVLDYHQRDNPHCPEAHIVPGSPITAVLDGQQRLTAFNIGLRGSMAVKRPYKWWNSPDAFPRRVLALDLLASAEPDEEGNRYTFEFIEDARLGCENQRLWFRVSDILNMQSGPSMLRWLTKHSLGDDELNLAFERLDRLYQSVHNDQTVCYYEEKNQDIEHVLNHIHSSQQWRDGSLLLRSLAKYSHISVGGTRCTKRGSSTGRRSEPHRSRPWANEGLCIESWADVDRYRKRWISSPEFHPHQYGSARKQLV